MDDRKQNVKVRLNHANAPEHLQVMMTRVIDGNLLQAQSVAGRAEEAKAIFNRMLGIVSTSNDYTIQETDEPPTQPMEMPRSTAAEYEKRRQLEKVTGMSAVIGASVAKAVQEVLQPNAKAAPPLDPPPPKNVPCNIPMTEDLAEEPKTLNPPAEPEVPTVAPTMATLDPEPVEETSVEKEPEAPGRKRLEKNKKRLEKNKNRRG